MIHPDDYGQYVESYLLGQLEGTDLRSFEQQLATDPALSKELAVQQAIFTQVETLGALQTEKRLLKIKKQYHQKQRTIRLRWLSLAAAAVIGLVLVVTLLRPSPNSPQQLYAQYYQAYELPLVNRGDAEEKTFTAARLYKSQQYAEALPLLQELYQAQPESSAYQLAIGICQLETRQLDEALRSFSQLVKDKDPQYEEQAIWYSALAYLKKEETKNARQQLENLLARDNAYHHASAKALFEKIKID